MTPPQLAPADGEARHWRIVLGTAIGLGTGNSVFVFIQSLFVLPLSQEFGWSRGQIAAAATTGLVTAALAPLIGRLADRYGARPVILASIALMAFGYAMLAATPDSLAWYYGAFFLMGLGGAGTTGMTYTRLVTGWFVRHRGLALGLSLAGVSVFAFLLPPLLSPLIETWGWRAGYVALAALAVLVGVPAVLGLLSDPPPPPTVAAEAGSGWRGFLAGTSRRPAFWLLFAAMVLVNVAGSPLLAQLTPLLRDRGFTLELAAQMLSLYAIAVLVGRLVTGALIDRFPAPGVACGAMLLSAAGCLLLAGAGDGATAVALAILMLGITQGAETDVAAFFVARHLGLANYSTTFGVMLGGVVIGNVSGAWLFGFGHDLTGSYSIALVVASACFAIGGVALLALRWQPRVDGAAVAASNAPAGAVGG